MDKEKARLSGLDSDEKIAYNAGRKVGKPTGGFPAEKSYKTVVQWLLHDGHLTYLSRLSKATTRVKIMRLIEMISKSLM